MFADDGIKDVEGGGISDAKEELKILYLFPLLITLNRLIQWHGLTEAARKVCRPVLTDAMIPYRSHWREVKTDSEAIMYEWSICFACSHDI